MRTPQAWLRARAAGVRSLAIAVVAVGFGLAIMAVPANAIAGGPSPVHVDAESVGGTCSNTYSAAQAQSPATPWCTVAKAIHAAPDGTTVYLRRGTHAAFVSTQAPTRHDDIVVRPFPAEGDRVALDGFTLKDADHVRFEGLRITGRAQIGPRSDDVEVSSSSFEDATLSIRPGSDRIRVLDNEFSVPDGYGVILSEETTLDKGDIVDVEIARNHFKAIGADAVQAKNFDGLLIADNEIENIKRRKPEEHCDAIQTVFGGKNLSIVGNYIHDGEGGFLIKDGTVEGLFIANNVLTRVSGSWPVMIFDAPSPTIVNNTVWGNEHGMILRGRTRDATVVNNVLQSFKFEENTSFYEDYNYVEARGRNDDGGEHSISTGIEFDERAGQELALAPDSAGVDSATSGEAPGTDSLGRRRVDVPAVQNRGSGVPDYVDMGAIEVQVENPEDSPTPAPSPTPTPSATPSPTATPDPVSQPVQDPPAHDGGLEPAGPSRPQPGAGASGPPAGGDGPGPRARIRLDRRSRGGKLRVRITCVGACRLAGRIVVRTDRGKQLLSLRRVVTAPAGGSRSISLKLSAAQRRELQKARGRGRRLHVDVELSSAGAQESALARKQVPPKLLLRLLR